MNMIAVRVFSAGAPCVVRYAWPNMLAEASSVTVMTNAVTGRRPGSVTLRNRAHRPAPSTAAAS